MDTRQALGYGLMIIMILALALAMVAALLARRQRRRTRRRGSHRIDLHVREQETTAAGHVLKP